MIAFPVLEILLMEGRHWTASRTHGSALRVSTPPWSSTMTCLLPPCQGGQHLITNVGLAPDESLTEPIPWNHDSRTGLSSGISTLTDGADLPLSVWIVLAKGGFANHQVS